MNQVYCALLYRPVLSTGTAIWAWPSCPPGLQSSDLCGPVMGVVWGPSPPGGGAVLAPELGSLWSPSCTCLVLMALMASLSLPRGRAHNHIHPLGTIPQVPFMGFFWKSSGLFQVYVIIFVTFI
jgi:hypothetical protein